MDLTFVVKLIAVGVGIGIVGGTVGIGGGVLLIPALTTLFDIGPRKAAGISLAVLAVPVTMPGAWRYYLQDHLGPYELKIAALLAVSFAAGTFLGAGLQNHLDQHSLRLFFGLLLLFVGVRTILHASPESLQAAVGLTVVVFGWLGHLGLRALGRKHLRRPTLADAIRRSAASAPPPDDYHI